MTTQDLKTEIRKVLEEVPGNSLPEVLTFLQEIQHRETPSIHNPENLKRILDEDDEVLKKLAQ